MRYLAIDYGLKRVGLAICDAQEIIVSPLTLLEIARDQGATKLQADLQQIVGAEHVAEVVVGLPLNMDGSEGLQATLTRKFATELAEALAVPVHLHDERLSSAAADEMLTQAGLSLRKFKGKRDMLAACAILQCFLDSKP